MCAYALMRQPEELEAVFVGSPFYERARIEIDALRAALPSRLPRCYRGIGRFPFTEYPELGPGWQGEAAKPVDPEPRSRELMLKFLGTEDQVTPYPRAFLREAGQPRSVAASLSGVPAYEMVELCTPPESPSKVLGFDVGYWGGGNFSILCDAAIWPTWHPPAPPAIPDLARLLSDLNQYGLFPTERIARTYLEWYKRQPWAEQEPSDFIVIAVGQTPSDVG